MKLPEWHGHSSLRLIRVAKLIQSHSDSLVHDPHKVILLAAARRALGMSKDMQTRFQRNGFRLSSRLAVQVSRLARAGPPEAKIWGKYCM